MKFLTPFFPFLILLLSDNAVFGQTANSDPADSLLAKTELSFAGYLTDNKQYEDASFLLKTMLRYPAVSEERLDSIRYMLARVFYLEQKLDSSNYYFSQLRPASAFAAEAGIFRSFGLMYQSRFSDAEVLLNKTKSLPDADTGFVQFMQSANDILRDDFTRIRQQIKGKGSRSTILAREEEHLKKLADDKEKNKRKSALAAGLLSAVLPGSGKFYAGYRGQAIAAFIPCFIFGVAALETYFRSGPARFPFIASSSLFGIFYLGNIWGGALSVKTYHEKRNLEIRNQVLLDVQIPMHRLFRQ